MVKRTLGLVLLVAAWAPRPLSASDSSKAPALAPADRKLADTVAVITRANYHGDRTELERQRS